MVHNTIKAFGERADAALEAAERAHESWYSKVSDPVGRETVIRAGISEAFNALAVAAVTLFVCIFVVSMITDSISLEEGDPFYESMGTVETTTGDAFTLAAVALIVLVASIILWLVRGFGGGDMSRM